MEKLSRELVKFEDAIADLFLDKQIKVPIHLAVGSEENVISVFNSIKLNDWVLATHRSHYQALLKGMSKEEVKNKILNGNSMHISSRKYKFLTSSIVGGVLPIAIGIAMGIRRKNLDDKVWVFIGDMAAEMGVFHECSKYAARNDLPIIFIIEDNGLCVETPTQESWGSSTANAIIIRYTYNRKYPHVGCGRWVTF